MNLKDILERYRKTLRAIRQGDELWRIPESTIDSSGLLQAASFNRMQNLLATLIALPMIWLGSWFAEDLERHAQTQFGCESRDLTYAWVVSPIATLVTIAIVVVTPGAVARLVSKFTEGGLQHNEAKNAYLFLNAAFTAKSKSVVLVLVSCMWIALFVWLYGESFLFRPENISPFGLTESEENLYVTILVSPFIVAALFILPFTFYARFLSRFAVSLEHPKSGSPATHTQRTRHFLPILIALAAGATFFTAAVLIPLALRGSLYMGLCGTLGFWFEMNF